MEVELAVGGLTGVAVAVAGLLVVADLIEGVVLGVCVVALLLFHNMRQ